MNDAQQFQQIKEVVEARSQRVANRYLDAGYVLLSIDNITVTRISGRGQEYNAQTICYVLGRSKRVEHLPREDAYNNLPGPPPRDLPPPD